MADVIRGEWIVRPTLYYSNTIPRYRDWDITGVFENYIENLGISNDLIMTPVQLFGIKRIIEVRSVNVDQLEIR